MGDQTIHLGFEVGTGNPVQIPCRHMVVAGQTQEAGKTTTLEALISRSGLSAVAFVTKRGEKSFSNAQRILPYFRERADWQFVASVLEAAMRERLKFERAWIMRASKGARTLAHVQDNVQTLMRSAKGLSGDVYYTLNEYLEIVVPRIARVQFAQSVRLAAGLNVVDLSDRDNFPPELQSLVMRSMLEYTYEHFEGTITIIPEAWEFIPQGRGSPVKLSAIELIRKGAGLRNYVWLDSQDIGGVDKELLRSCTVWLLGVQREANEIARTLGNIPAGIARPKPSDIATLEKGQFFACWGKHVVKTYVQPEWMHETEARSVAMGKATAKERPPTRPKPIQIETEANVTEEQATELRNENESLRQEVLRLQKLLDKKAEAQAQPTKSINGHASVDELYGILLARLLKDPAIMKLNRSVPELNISVTRRTVQADESSAQGMVAILLGEGFLNNTTTATTVWKELKRRWNYGGISARCYEQLDKLTEMGFVTKESDGYLAVPGMKVNIIKS